ncbi:MAG: hypothetical protein KDK12_17930 [Rhodobacteraceae bacterium]|nr:hypothetical protein [Paracoccaceae bacterium]
MAANDRLGIELDRRGVAILVNALAMSQGAPLLWKTTPAPTRDLASKVRPKDFAWPWSDFEAHPALWAYCAVELPQRASHIDQETPIARRSEDDAIKSLIWLLPRLLSRSGSTIRIDMACKPVQWPKFYRELMYWREMGEVAKPRGRPPYVDGVFDAALLAQESQDARRSDGEECTDFDAAEWVIQRRTGWVQSNSIYRPPPEEIRVFGCDKGAAIYRVERQMREMREEWRKFSAVEAGEDASKLTASEMAAADANRLETFDARARASAEIDRRLALSNVVGYRELVKR